MDTATFNEYLEKRYYDQLKYYESASAKNQKRYKNFQWILIVLSTLTTILAALPRSDKFDMQYVVVVTAGLVAILTSGLKTFQYQELWVTYRSTIEQLKPEIYYYNFNLGEYGQAGIDKESLFVSRVEQILNKEHDAWPIFKKLKDQNNQQVNDDLQRKLDELIREKFNTQKNNQPEVPVDVNQSQDVIDANQTNKPGDSNQGHESSDTNQTENAEQTITDNANTVSQGADPNEEEINNNENKSNDKTNQ